MADDFAQKTTDFLQWFRAIPGVWINPKVQLTDLRVQGHGRGLVAVDDITVDEDLFTTPRVATLTASTSKLTQQLALATLEPFSEQQWLLLILLLIYEHLQGSGSFWQPYLDILPHSFDTLMFWSKDELCELQASAICGKIGRSEADKTFRTEILPFVKSHAEAFYPTGVKNLDDEELLALAHRMGSTIMAYAFDLEQQSSSAHVDEEGYATEDEEQMPKGLVAMADMLNADADFNARLFQEKSSVTMKATRAIRKGDEIMNDYGPLPRADLLRRYGYLTPKYAKYDVVELSRDLIVDALKNHHTIDDGEITTRIAHLEDRDQAEEAYIIERDAGDTDHPNNGIIFSEFPEDLVLFLKTLLAEPEEYKRVSKLDEQRQSQLMIDVGRIMAEVLRRRVDQYKSSITEDTELLRDQTIQGRRRMAIEVRLGEKEVLKEAQAYASSIVLTYEPNSSGKSTERSQKRRKLN
ncbi:MAG: hypothetical protein M1828_004907 [Chrysothrix sp. TS-e1954]|nr:MAG: hypothetical protein M1828_004907 [Chrysothrix sp. TS-e1954]